MGTKAVATVVVVLVGKRVVAAAGVRVAEVVVVVVVVLAVVVASAVVVVGGRCGTSATVLDLRPPSAEKFGRPQGFPWLEFFPRRWRKGRLGQPGSSSKPQPSGA